MKIRYWPEGRLLHTAENQLHCSSAAHLQAAMENQIPLEGRVLFCDPFCNLTVKLGNFTGIIPYEEGAIGIREGTTRDIALLSRVGKAVSFFVTRMNEDGSLLLSRRSVQEAARAYLLEEGKPGDIIPATVTHLEPFGVFVDIGCGVPSLIGIESISVSRISHPNQRFLPEQEIFAVITDFDFEQKRVSLSHKELLGSWEENIASLAPGMTVTGIVRSIKEYGVFIELAPNLSGLAEIRPDISVGDAVSVYIKSILPDRLKIKLLIIAKLPSPTPLPPIRYFHTEGHMQRWEYAPKGCSKLGPVSVFGD